MCSGSHQIPGGFGGPCVGGFLPLVVDWLRSYFGGGGDFFAEERMEWFGEFAADVVVVVDADLLEYGLVELASDEWACFEVGGVPVGGELECLSHIGFGSVELDFDGLEALSA